MKYLLSLLLLIGTMSLSAQDVYHYVIGARAGNPLGATYKTFIGRYTGYEVIAGVNYSYEKNGFTATGLYQYNYPLFYFTNIYAGAGLTMGAADKFIFHLDAQIGIEYTIQNFPLQLAVDYKPIYAPFHKELGRNGFGWYEYGISIRYVIR